MKIILFLLGVLFWGQNSGAQISPFEIVNPQIYQGGVVIVRVNPQWQGPMVCVHAFEKQYIPNRYGYVYIGVAVNTEPTNTREMSLKYPVYLVECGRGVRLNWQYGELEVIKKDFGTPWYAGPANVPSKAVQDRRIKEVALMRAAYDLAEKYEDYTSDQFIYPLDNIEVTDFFGVSRLYGSYSRRTKRIIVKREVPHGGVDFRAKTPLPVMAINSGKVLLAHNFSLSGTEGNLLVIDHGSGILSLYLHLSKFTVGVGDLVKSGQTVAFTGATPRGTPPHLHFMVKVNGVNVDPIAFIESYNKYIGR
ncbi:MAG: M23 family metallopeptidase [Candidatus Yanofskybacteria bacterium]|nr:M23 family metallopeptidase [Candidatus Yanofskybacteria bacterium]